MRLEWAPLAQVRVLEAARYIAKHNPDAAERWVIGVFDSVRKLERLPNLGRIVPEIGRPEFREIRFGRYRIVYRVSERQIDILTVRHERRLFDPAEVITPGP